MEITYLYQLFDDSDHLLYVGISNGPIHRLFQHLEEKPWAPQITWQHVSQFSNREDAAAAERHMIETTRPLYNIQFNNEELADQVRAMHLKNRQDLVRACHEYDIPCDPHMTISDARRLVRNTTGQDFRFNKDDWTQCCKHVNDFETKKHYSRMARDSDLFAMFEQHGIPKDPQMSVRNARALARLHCGPFVPNFGKDTWLAWCARPAGITNAGSK